MSLIVPPERIVALMKERAEHIAGCTATEIQRALIEAWVEGANEAFHVDDTVDKLGLR